MKYIMIKMIQFYQKYYHTLHSFRQDGGDRETVGRGKRSKGGSVPVCQ